MVEKLAFIAVPLVLFVKRNDMKTYEEMIALVCDNSQNSHRYAAWTAYIIIGYMFNKTPADVSIDVQAEVARLEKQYVLDCIKEEKSCTS